jgi:hypothetical protein
MDRHFTVSVFIVHKNTDKIQENILVMAKEALELLGES